MDAVRYAMWGQPPSAACPEPRRVRRAQLDRFYAGALHLAAPFFSSTGAGGLANFASSTGTFCLTSLT